MACFAFVMHALYVTRVRIIKEDRLLDPKSAVASRFRASLECQLKSLCWWYRFEDCSVREEWLLDGAWLKELKPTFLVYTCTWPSPPY
jgi:hypothetical protein